MKLSPSTAPRQWTPQLAALIQAALRVGLHLPKKQMELKAK